MGCGRGNGDWCAIIMGFVKTNKPLIRLNKDNVCFQPPLAVYLPAFWQRRQRCLRWRSAEKLIRLTKP